MNVQFLKKCEYLSNDTGIREQNNLYKDDHFPILSQGGHNSTQVINALSAACDRHPSVLRGLTSLHQKSRLLQRYSKTLEKLMSRCWSFPLLWIKGGERLFICAPLSSVNWPYCGDSHIPLWNWLGMALSCLWGEIGDLNSLTQEWLKLT